VHGGLLTGSAQSPAKGYSRLRTSGWARSTAPKI
jgi:hypothetical protein